MKSNFLKNKSGQSRVKSAPFALVMILTQAAHSAPPKEPVPVGEKTVTSTIVIRKSGTYDFKKVLHIWKGSNWNCNADKENGPQILRIEADDVVIKNFYYVGDGKTKGSNGLGDPVHVASCGSGQGNRCGPKGPKRVVLDGIYGHACEDLLTIGTPGTDNITIQNSYLKAAPNKNAWDKTVQINFGSRIRFLNNIFVGGERCIRFKPNTDGEVIGNSFFGCKTAIKASSNDADIAPMKNGPVRLVVRNNKYENVKNQISKQGNQVYVEN